MTSTINFSYPLFVPRQVLRSEDLNNIVDYLDEQNRLTRTHLFGIGIVFGLMPEWKLHEAENRSWLTISPGIGLSSKGYLFNIQECVLRSYAEITMDTDKFLCEEDVEDPTGFIELWELAEHENGTLIEEDTLEDKVILFFWDQEQNIRETCFTSCDDTVEGEVKVVIRKFAVNMEDACKITKNLCLEEGQELTAALPDIGLKRFGYASHSSENPEPGIYPGEIVDFTKFFDNYKKNCIEGIKDLSEQVGDIVAAYTTAAERFAGLFELDENFAGLESHLLGRAGGQLGQDGNELPEVTGLLQQMELEPNKKGIQYFYDFLKDLVLAYEEFAATRFARQLSTRPDPCLFPNHILLGRIDVSGYRLEIDDEYRTKLIRPPIEGLEDSDFNLAKHLFERMVALARSRVEEDKRARFLNVEIPVLIPNAAETNGNPKIKITPSKGKWFPLSKRAIPYYYKEASVGGHDAPIRKYWSYEAWFRKRQERIPAYYPVADGTQGAFLIREGHLLYDMDAYNFFRIEGHLFRDLDKALESIEQERERLNLPFDIRCVKLDLDQEYPMDPDCGKYQLEMPDLELDYQKCRIELLCDEKLRIVEGGTRDGEEKPPATKLVEFLEEVEKVAVFVQRYDEFKAMYESVFPTSPRDCKMGCFKIIKASYEERCKEIIKQLRFPDFARAHPGLEHCAGVQKGGTFILVYTDLLADQRSLYTLLQDKVPKNGQERADGIVIPKEEFDKNSKNDAGLIYMARTYKTGLDLIKSQVIADFCLPYTCCSKAPVIQYVLTKAPPVILLTPDHFCSNDENQYPITALPEGGRFEPLDWVVKDDMGKYWFKPNAVPDEEYDGEWVAKVEIVYVYGGQIATKEITVYKQPVARYAVEKEREELFDESDPKNPCRLIGYAYTFTDISEYAHSIEWRVDGELKGTGPVLKYEVLFDTSDFPFELYPELRAYAKKSICRDVYQREIPIIVQCPSLEIEPLDPLDVQDDKTPDGTPITSYVYEKKAQQPAEDQEFTLRVNPVGGDVIHNNFIINGIDENGSAVDIGLLSYLILEPGSGENPCADFRYSFIYDPGTAASGNLAQLPDGLYRFQYTLNCGENVAEAWVRLRTGPAEDVVFRARESAGREGAGSEEGSVGTTSSRSIADISASSGQPEEEANDFMAFNRRLTARRERLTRLETDSSLAQTKTYRESKAFELFSGQDISLLEKRFDDVMNLLINSHSRSSGERKVQYGQLMEIMLHSFNDKVVAARRNKVPDSTRRVFREFLPRLKSRGMDVEAIRHAWEGQALKAATGASSVDELEGLFKNA